MDARPHNAQDGRCRYTLGAERCPAPGVMRVGQWWVCALHEVWAERPQDPEYAEEGKVALRIQQDRHQQGAAGSSEVGAVSVPGLAAMGAGSAKEAAMAMLDPSVLTERELARETRRRKIGERAVEVFGRAVRERRAAGVERDAAILSAVREVAVAAIEQHWGTER